MRPKQVLGGIFLMLIGVFSLFLAAKYLLGFEQLNADVTSSCRAICGLGLLVSQFLGEKIGAYFVGVLWLVAGVWITYSSYSLLTKNSD